MNVPHPRQCWFRQATAGLFLHWGIGTAPGFPDAAAWERAVTASGWHAGYWVAEAAKLHAQYLVFACFHSRLGYARAWPSQVPGSGSTRRDFLGELVAAAGRRGMKVLLYLTDDPRWHAAGRAGGSWLDCAAYSAYKGRPVDLTTGDGFGEFSQDVAVEVMDRYPDLAGLWIDRDNPWWIAHGLYERVRAERPMWTLSNNHADDPMMDVAGYLDRTGMTPEYDYPQAVSVAAPRLAEADFPVAGSDAWWYDGSDPPVDRGLALRRYISNAGAGVTSLLAETAQLDGRFPGHQAAFNDFVRDWLAPIWSSIGGTHAGGYRDGGLKPGFWNDGAHGVTTVSRADPDLHHVHVLTPPAAGVLRLRDNGYRVVGVHQLRNGTPVRFRQRDGFLTLAGLGRWDPYDTVFTVISTGRHGIHPRSSYTVTATAAADGHPPRAVADGNPGTFWDNDRTLPVSLVFHLDTARPVRYIGLNQREDSVSYRRSPTEQSGRIRDYRVFVDPTGSDPAGCGTLPSHRGVALIDLPAVATRRVRLEILSTWADAEDPHRYRRVRIEEAWLGADHP